MLIFSILLALTTSHNMTLQQCTLKPYYLAYIKEKYFNFKAVNDYGFAFWHIENEFATASHKMIKYEGFSLRYMIRKNKWHSTQ